MQKQFILFISRKDRNRYVKCPSATTDKLVKRTSAATDRSHINCHRLSSAIYWNWYVMFPDPTHRYGWSLTAVRVQTRNERSSMTTAVSTRGIKNVYEVALMTMLGKEQLVLDSPWVVLGRRKKKKNLFPVGKYNTDTQNAGMFLSWTWITMS